MCEPCKPDALLEAVRGLRVAEPELGFKPLLAKLREQQPDLGAATKEVREALAALKAESKASEAAASPPAVAAPPSVGRGSPPLPASLALSLACFGCARLPSDMGDGREKHPVCPKCRKYKVPTTYWCCVECPGNPGAWKLHAVYHKGLKGRLKVTEDGGVIQQQNREAAELEARRAAQSGDAYDELLAEGARYSSEEDWRRAARTYREAIALRPDEPGAYCNLGAALCNSDHYVEAAQRYLEAMERQLVGSETWARITAWAFDALARKACDQVAKPEWWNDKGLKALSAWVVRAAPDEVIALSMRAVVLGGQHSAWETGPRSAAELMEAATHYERAAALHPAPALKAEFASEATWCRSLVEVMQCNGLAVMRYSGGEVTLART